MGPLRQQPQVIGECGASADVPQPMLLTLQFDRLELLAGLGGGPGVQRYPLDRFAARIILNGDPGIKAVQTPPEPAYFMLAIVESLNVFVAA